MSCCCLTGMSTRRIEVGPEAVNTPSDRSDSHLLSSLTVSSATISQIHIYIYIYRFWVYHHRTRARTDLGPSMIPQTASSSLLSPPPRLGGMIRPEPEIPLGGERPASGRCGRGSRPGTSGSECAPRVGRRGWKRSMEIVDVEPTNRQSP